MNNQDFLNMAQNIISAHRELAKIAKTINRLDCNDCNGYPDTDYGRKAEARNNTRRENLLKRAQELAGRISLKIYHQGDPRGCSLYLISPNLERPAEKYTQGIAIY